jgi:hypothetical protein
MRWGALALAVAAPLTLAPAAWGPPAVGVPIIGVGTGCATLGRGLPVTGTGFEPGSEVRVTAPIGNYPGFADIGISDTGATANANGWFDATLNVPEGPPRSLWFFNPRAVFVNGTAVEGGDPVERFVGVVLGTRAVCRVLDPRPELSLWHPRISTETQTVRHPCFGGGRYDTAHGGQTIADPAPCELQKPLPATLRLRDRARVIVETPARAEELEARFDDESSSVHRLGFGGTVWELRARMADRPAGLSLSVTYARGTATWTAPVATRR